MIHATDAALDRLEPLLQKIRCFDSLQEKSRGVFYRKSQAFLHFHEDPSGLFADIRITDDWTRMPVNMASEQVSLLEEISKALQ